ncbi:MAG TPA: amidohydrolase, partial [Streptosporangiaceae bacterium]|nr:amidohydrolase [Streptosporangiaceae bacterium]
MRAGLGVALLLASATVSRAGDAPAGLVLHNARVWTAEADHPWAEAVAVRDVRIAAVGSRAAVDRLRGPRTVVLDLGGRLVLPGFVDAHIHLIEGALSLQQVDVSDDSTVEATQARIRAFAAAHSDEAWVVGQGWLYGTFPGGLPTRAQLDAAVPDRPTFISCYDGHTGWANSRALALAGITRDTKDPEKGVIVRDPATGEPTGALKESAVSLVTKAIPLPGPERRYELLLQALRRLNEQGVTAVGDAGYGLADLPGALALFERAETEGRLTVRTTVSVQIEPRRVGPAVAEARRLFEVHHGPRLFFGPVKGFVDGVVEAHTAALLAPYADDSSFGTGLPNWTPAQLEAAALAVDKAGLPLWLHAIGDGAVRMALDAHQAPVDQDGPRDRRCRIEHAETIATADYPRFRALGVIASMQPLHANPDQNNEAVWVRNLGPDRASRGFSWGNVERAGGRLAFGSDWPVVTSDVMRGLYCAVTRRTRDGWPPGGWLPEQAVPVESALRHYTIDAAYSMGQEAETGSLTVGKRADLVVLSQDVLSGDPSRILETKVLLTLIDGRAVHEDSALPGADRLAKAESGGQPSPPA